MVDNGVEFFCSHIISQFFYHNPCGLASAVSPYVYHKDLRVEQ